MSAKSIKESAIPKRSPGQPIPLTFAQLQMWLMDRMVPGNPAYGVPVGYRLWGKLDITALKSSFNDLIRRHEILRTTFIVDEGQPCQIVHPHFDIRIPVTDFDNMPVEEAERELRARAAELAMTPFDLARLPLLRASLFKLDEAQHVLIIHFHHIVGDGKSIGLLLDDMDAFYRIHIGKNHVGDDLSPLSLQYADYAVWEREIQANTSFAKQIDFWKRKLQTPLPILELPLDFPRPPTQSFRGSNTFIKIPKELAQSLAALGAGEGCTIFTTLLTALQVLLHRYSGAEDIVIGTPLSTRGAGKNASMMGIFLNVVPLRCDLSGIPTFRQLLRRTRGMTLHAFARADLPYGMLVEHLALERGLNSNPVFQVMFEMLPTVRSQIGDLEVSNYYFDLGFSQFDLSLHVWEDFHDYVCRFEYCTDLFSRGTIERMSANFLHLLSTLVGNPERQISTVPSLTDSQWRQVVVDWNDTSRHFTSDQCVHHLFEHKAAATPEHLAVECAGQALTYEELNSRANQFSNYLISLGIQKEGRVGVCLERSVDLVVVLLGILKAGAAYVPLDPSFPRERLGYIMDDAGIEILATQTDLLQVLPRSKQRTVCIDTDRTVLEHQSARNVEMQLNPSGLAYIIYTSGSTGRPKGVMIEHRSLVNFLIAMKEKPGFGDQDVIVGVTTVSFDIAALEIFLPLISGGKLVMATKNEAIDGSLLIGLLTRSRATMLQATPATWKLLIDADWSGTPGLKMLCGGEALARGLANQLIERGDQLWNMYGPTETTVWSSAHQIEPGEGPVLIGPPILNTTFYIVDKNLEPVPVGVWGELLIGGAGLARGYLNRPELNAERFVTAPFLDSRSRLYKTGDLTRFHPDGRIEFIGRLDLQVKIRGHRIELEEIEQTLRQYEDIKDSATLAWENADGDKRLVAYYIPFDGKSPKASALREFIHQRLPEYMCPSFFVEMPAFPLTPNGKVDRKAFPKPDGSGSEIEPSYVPPQGELEVQLASIWRAVLKTQRVGIDDNFFELGGHSLLAAQLFAQIDKRLGVNIPLAILFRAPTIRKLAEHIEQKTWRSIWSSLVPIQPQGARPPLFLIHGAEGNVLLYRNLAGKLGNTQPVYGLQSAGLDGKEQIGHDVASMAAKYIEEIRSVQSTGPYYLAGYCLGGTIALEMAQRLKKEGESVALLAMIETYNVKTQSHLSFPVRMIHKLQNICYQVGNVVLSLSHGSLEFFTEKLQVELSRFSVHCKIWLGSFADRLDLGRGHRYNHLEIRDRNHHAQMGYSPKFYDGEIVLFKPRTHFFGLTDQHFGWGKIARDGVQVVEMANYPRAALNEPFVDAVARALISRIDKSINL